MTSNAIQAVLHRRTWSNAVPETFVRTIADTAAYKAVRVKEIAARPSKQSNVLRLGTVRDYVVKTPKPR